METVSVLICTYGDKSIWNPLAARAMHSVCEQTRQPDEIIRYHGKSLHQARNHAAEMASSSHLLFLDADDELHYYYIQCMLEEPCGYLRYPRVQYLTEEMQAAPILTLNKRPLFQGNYMVIGTLMERESFLRVGGFRDLPAYEDWDLFIRLWIDSGGRDTALVPGAIYRIFQRKGGRNNVENPQKLFKEIIDTYDREAFEKGLI